MAYCQNCGEEIDEQAEVCTHCGVNQTNELTGDHGERGANEKYCSNCGELINKQADICPECGVRQGSTGSGAEADTDQTVAGILAILLGGLGAHKFYQGRVGLGLVYLCFSWTFIPAVIGLVEGILMLVADEEEYAEKYADGDIFGA
jgi:TM2 domain-containing membrane protein YozV/RNA polymerase subunit RPABC4/transcription elongation factor Spt4